MTYTHPAFTLLDTQVIPDIQSTGYLFRHNKTGAQVAYFENADTNKSFSINFVTPPSDDTGIAHIIEHSVLCGSRQYPSKEPFTELLKGSLNTFLNAMTYPDKTMYPVASQNDKDFSNLMDVYLDAVFFPNLHDNPLILQQEGWHYHLEDINDDLIYKGVVYNEMKGAFSAPDSVLHRHIDTALFPDTLYAHESGGLPEAIPQLTQEMFSDFHKRYYHPSNAYAVLYGKLDILERLTHLDSYFAQFERREPLTITNDVQAPFAEPITDRITYSLAEGEDTAQKTFLNLSYAIGDVTDTELSMAMNVLEEILLGNNASPLRKALLASGLGSDVSGGFSNYTRQTTFSVTLKNSEEAHTAAFQQLVTETLETLVSDGIDADLVKAAFNKIAFDIKESVNQNAYPLGVFFAIDAMPHWVNGQSPFASFHFDKHLQAVQEKIASGYLEQLISEKLLRNPHAALIIAAPEVGKLDRQEAATHQYLQNYKASLTPEQQQQLVADTHALLARQTQPDTPEDLAKIPLLSLDDVSKEPTDYPLAVTSVDSVDLLHYDTFTSGIAYVSYLFDLTTVSLSDLPYAALLAQLLGNMGTTDKDLDTLTTTINQHTGGLSFQAVIFNENTAEARFHPKFIAKGKAFTHQTTALLDLLHEVLTQTAFDDNKKLKELLQRIKSQLEMSMTYQSHIVAFNRVRSYYSHAAYLDDQLHGLAFYQFISDLLTTYDTQFEQLVAQLRRVATTLFTRNNLNVSYIGNAEDFAAFKAQATPVLATLSDTVYPQHDYHVPLVKRNEGFETSQAVQYVAKGFNAKKLGYQTSGALHVLKTVLSLDYLWNEVRVKGGAYGGFASITRDGDLLFGSYRDPNLTETINVYDQAADYLAAFKVDDRELTKYILGTISTLDKPLTPQAQGEAAVARYLTHAEFADLQRERQEVLQTSTETLRALAPLIRDVMSQDYFCVLGSAEKIKQHSTIFGETKKLIP